MWVLHKCYRAHNFNLNASKLIPNFGRMCTGPKPELGTKTRKTQSTIEEDDQLERSLN